MHPKFSPSPPPSEKAILDFTTSLRKQLPSDYLSAMAFANGGTGFVGNRYVKLWPVEKLLELNNAYQIQKYCPNLFAIGSHGGGETYVFDLAKSDGAIYSIPLVGMEPAETEFVSPSFDTFVPRANFLR
jgi:hypothetical protein